MNEWNEMIWKKVLLCSRKHNTMNERVDGWINEEWLNEWMKWNDMAEGYF